MSHAVIPNTETPLKMSREASHAAAPAPCSSGYSLNRCFIGIIRAVRSVSTQINKSDSSRKNTFLNMDSKWSHLRSPAIM